MVRDILKSMPGSLIPRTTHLEILTLLLAMLSASALVFWMLVRRMTVQRQQISLIEWGKQAGLKLVSPDPSHLIGSLRLLRENGAAVEICLENPRTRLLKLHMDEAPAGRSHLPANWNILLRGLEQDWKPAGLRPSSAVASVLDFFSLSSFPTAGGTERFLLFAIDSDAAAAFPVSAAQALLPQDVGLLMHGREMILDFSQRPFDDLEFDRLIALAEQLAAKLIQQTQ